MSRQQHESKKRGRTSRKEDDLSRTLHAAVLGARTTGQVRRTALGIGRQSMDWIVFGVAGAMAVLFVIWGIVGQQNLASVSTTATAATIEYGGWFYVITATFFVIFVIWLAASRYGNIKLGADDEKPQFRTISWIAMMFSAGMGIGLMYFGAAEPLSFFTTARPPGTEDAVDGDAMRTAMATSLFHWGLHPWAIYAVVAIAIAYGTFRKGRRQLISAAFWPIFGRKTEGWVGKVIDCLAIFATLFGSAASLGLGALQIGAGLEFNGWVDQASTPLLVGIIAVLTIAFVASAVSGIAKGIQWLSNINMVLALGLALFVFVVGPTLLILNLLPETLGAYFSQMGEMAARTGAGGEETLSWLSSWTIFYWAWWVSWTPFVGLFIARISRGRTIRQLITGLLFVPTTVSLVWFTIFGGSAISEQMSGETLLLPNAEGEPAVQTDFVLFQLLERYPAASVTAIVVMLLVAIFFVSGADAASIVMGSLSERGAEEPRRWTVIFWGLLTGGVAAIMLAISQDGTALTGLQNITIVASAPFAIVMLMLCLSLWKDLRSDPWVVRSEVGQKLVEQAVVDGVVEHGTDFTIAVGNGSDSVFSANQVAESPVVEEIAHRVRTAGDELGDNSSDDASPELARDGKPKSEL